MDVSGQMRTSCPPAAFVSSLQDASLLLPLLPRGSRIEQAADGTLSFALIRDIGPVKLTLPGKMSVTPTGQGHNQTLIARASHIIGGKVDMDLDLRFGEAEGLTLLTYSGHLTATGIAGRVMTDRKDRVNAFLKSFLLRIKVQAERRLRQGTV